MDGRLLLVGCGKMGGALLAGWIDRGIDAGAITVIEPNQVFASTIRDQYGVEVKGGPDELASGATTTAVTVFAVKPQDLDKVAPAYRVPDGADTVFLTIAAGRTLASLAPGLGADAAVVRAMPNLPAAVRRGITVLVANHNVTAEQRVRAQDLLDAVGEVAWVDDEGLLDAVTALSGSGPAYVFLMIESMTEAGVAAGLSLDLATSLARATVIGAAELTRQSPESAETLRQNVTSPGGTTAAALEVLMASQGLGPLMTEAVAAATKRSRELAK